MVEPRRDLELTAEPVERRGRGNGRVVRQLENDAIGVVIERQNHFAR